ncbi:hypothetical protein OC835_006190 [Tilletia horrida]|nr:hypothetical protein OC835_006190 [Tilletia horrida]
MSTRRAPRHHAIGSSCLSLSLVIESGKVGCEGVVAVVAVVVLDAVQEVVAMREEGQATQHGANDDLLQASGAIGLFSASIGADVRPLCPPRAGNEFLKEINAAHGGILDL